MTERYRLTPMMIDSEGAGPKIGLIVAADDHGQVFILRTGQPITTMETLEFLCSLPEDRLLVGYSLGYDHAMWLRDLSLDDKKRLVHGQKWVRFGPYRLNLFASELVVEKTCIACATVQPKLLPDPLPHAQNCTCIKRQISDVFKFFQSSFLAAIGSDKGGWKAATDAELALITEGKEGRGGFTWDIVISDKTLEYCRAECIVGARLVEMVRSAVNGLGEGELKSFFGAGSVAKMFLKNHDFNKFLPKEGEHVEGTTPGILSAIRRALIGGRFESAYFGPLPSKIFEQDIASAYPAFYERLICQRHAYWVQGHDSRDHNSLVEVSWSLPHGTLWGPFPVRDRSGTVICPREGRGMYWGHEVLAAEAMFPGLIRRHRVTSLVTECECDVASWVPELMDRRFRLADKNSGEGISLKLGANAFFGVTAQALGNQRFTSLIWAGQVTASARAQLLDAMARIEPHQIIMAATDALYTTVPIPDLDTREMTLGAWEVKEYPHGAFIMAPGVAIFPKAGKGGDDTLKTRGMEKKSFRLAAPQMMDAWAESGPHAKVTVKASRFIGLKAGIMRPELYGTWEDQEKQVSIGSWTKREHPPLLPGQMWPEPYLTLAPKGGREMSCEHKPPSRRGYKERDTTGEFYFLGESDGTEDEVA
jgi:hypothetical protein